MTLIGQIGDGTVGIMLLVRVMCCFISYSEELQERIEKVIICSLFLYFLLLKHSIKGVERLTK